MSKTRTEVAKFRLTSDELFELDAKAYELKIKRSTLLRMLCVEKKVVLYDFSKLDSLSYEIGKIGININQIAKKLNQGGTMNQENAEFLLTSMEAINKTLKKIYSDTLKKSMNCEDG